MPNIVGMHHQIVVNNHHDRIVDRLFQNTNVTIPHHIRNTENSLYANFVRMLKSHDHLDHSSNLNIVSTRWDYFVIILAMVFLLPVHLHTRVHATWKEKKKKMQKWKEKSIFIVIWCEWMKHARVIFLCLHTTDAWLLIELSSLWFNGWKSTVIAINRG